MLYFKRRKRVKIFIALAVIYIFYLMFGLSDVFQDTHLDKFNVQDAFANVNGHRKNVETDYERQGDHRNPDVGTNGETHPVATKLLTEESKGDYEKEITVTEPQIEHHDEEDKERRHLQIAQPHDDDSPGE